VDLGDRLHQTAAHALMPGEQVVSFTTCEPARGSARRTAGFLLGGLSGALIAKGLTDPTHALGGTELPHDLALVLTDRRVLVVALSAVSGRPSYLVTYVPLIHLRGVSVEEVRSGRVRFTLWNADGSRLALETSGRRASRRAESFCARLAEAGGGAPPPGPGPGS